MRFDTDRGREVRDQEEVGLGGVLRVDPRPDHRARKHELGLVRAPVAVAAQVRPRRGPLREPVARLRPCREIAEH